MILFFLCNAVENTLISTGAFEVTFNGKKIIIEQILEQLCYLSIPLISIDGNRQIESLSEAEERCFV